MFNFFSSTRVEQMFQQSISDPQQDLQAGFQKGLRRTSKGKLASSVAQAGNLCRSIALHMKHRQVVHVERLYGVLVPPRELAENIRETFHAVFPTSGYWRPGAWAGEPRS